MATDEHMLSPADLSGVAARSASAESGVATWHDEWRRKRIHMLPGLIPFGMWLIYHEDPLPLWNLGVVAGAVAMLTLFAIRRARGLQLRLGESWARTCGSYAVGPVALLFMFPANAEYAAAVVCILAFGDSTAALAGRWLGKTGLPWNADKTWVGSIVFLLAACPIATLAYWGEAAHPRVSLAAAAIIATAGTLLAAVAESVRSRIDDNLRIGVVAAIGIVVTGKLLQP